MSLAREPGTVSLQTLLVMLSALATLPLLAFALWLLNLVWQGAQSETRRDLQQMTATLAVALDREIAGSIRELQRIAEFPTLGTGDLAPFHAYARELVERNDGWDNVVLADVPGGLMMLDSSAPLGEPVALPAAMTHLADVARSGRPVVSDVHEATDGGYAIGVAVPVQREGRVRYVLSARLSPDGLSRFVGAQLAREGAIASVLDREHRLVARSRGASRYLGQLATPDLREALVTERGARRLFTLDGMQVLAAWERMPSGWTVVTGVPVSMFDAPLARSFGGLLAFGLAVLAAGVALSLLLGRRISAAIDAVAADARLLADGEPVAPRRSSIPVTPPSVSCPIRCRAALLAAVRTTRSGTRPVARARSSARWPAGSRPLTRRARSRSPGPGRRSAGSRSPRRTRR